MEKSYRATRLIFLALGLAVACWAPMIPILKIQLSLDNGQLGLLMLVQGIGAVLVMPLASWLVNRWGSSLVIIISSLLVLTSLPISTIAPTAVYLGIALFFFGAATSIMNIAINAQAISVESRSGRSLMSGFHCLLSVGGLLGVVFITLLLNYNWNIFCCASLISIVIALIIVSQGKNFIPDESSRKHSKASPATLELKVLILGVLCFVAFMSEGCILDWSAEFLHSSLHYSTARAGIGYAFFSIAMITGRLLGDRIVSRYGQSITFQMSAILAASGFIILVSRWWPYAELMGALLIGLGASNMVPILFSAAGKSTKTAPHSALAIITSFGFAGLLIGPVLVGFVSNVSSLALGLGGIAPLLFFSGVFGPVLALRPIIKKGAPEN